MRLQVLTAAEIRMLIVQGLSDANRRRTPAPPCMSCPSFSIVADLPLVPPATYDSILAGYLPTSPPLGTAPLVPSTSQVAPTPKPRGYLDGLI